MYHGVKKIRFHQGQDSNQALMRKLVLNFIKHGKLETTLKRAKAVKSEIDSLTYKSLTKTEGSKNVLLRKLGDKAAVNKMINEVGPIFKTGTGGFVRLVRIGQRQGDNAEVAQLTWTKNVEPQKEVKAEAPKKVQKPKVTAKTK